MLATVTRWVIHGGLRLEEIALEMKGQGHNLQANRNWWRQQQGNGDNIDEASVCLSALNDDQDDSESPLTLSPSSLPPQQTRLKRYARNFALLILGAALVSYYAIVHVRIIQTEDQIFYTTWFYEWFMIPVLISFVFAAPMHRALGCLNDHHPNGDCNDNDTTISNTLCCEQRLRLLERDGTTQRLILAVMVCYVAYIAGDASFFIPLSPNHTHLTTYVIYLLAVLTNMTFIYQGFLLSILTVRIIVVRLQQVEHQVNLAVKGTTRICATTSTITITHEQIMEWVQAYQDLRYDMQSLSQHFGVRMVLGITMFVVEVTNIILNVWEAIGSDLTRLQTLFLLLTYIANAAVLIMLTFQTAYTVTMCTETIGPPLALLSMRTSNKNMDTKTELNVLAQTFMQAPIRLRAGNFHITADYANALAAWFFGLFLVVFGLKLPKI